MIYVDVTAACLLPLQSGIPRTTRGIHRLLAEHRPDTIPLCWQPFRARYTELSARARTLLDDPFATPLSAKKAPRDSTIPLLLASFRDLLNWPPVCSLEQTAGRGDTLVLTSLFPDNRLEYLHRLASGPGWKIAIFHDAIPLHDRNVAGWERKRHLKALHLLSRMDLVIAVSGAAAHDLGTWWQRHGMSPAPVQVLPWPVPFTGPRPPASEPPRERKRILYVSRLKETKNHRTLFAACLALWGRGLDFDLELIGCEDEAKESRAVLKRVKEMQAEGDRIVWRGHVSEEELHRAYREATFTVFPSLMEGFGLPVIESLWHGRPVICGDDGAVGELAGQGGCLICDVRSSGLLAEAIASLLEEDAKCLALAEEAWSRPFRSWVDYGAELLPLLEPR